MLTGFPKKQRERNQLVDGSSGSHTKRSPRPSLRFSREAEDRAVLRVASLSVNHAPPRMTLLSPTSEVNAVCILGSS